MNPFKSLILLLIPAIVTISCNDDQNMKDELVVDNSLSLCLPEIGSDNTFEIATWNIENFPMKTSTPALALGTIIESEYDIWALQEIARPAYLENISSIDNRFEFIVDQTYALGVNEDYHLSYIYNSTQLELQRAEVLNSEDFESYYFPRKPFLAKFRKGNNYFYIINIHLKCCGGEENRFRRQQAGIILDNYIKSKLQDYPTIIVGDFNTVIDPYEDSDMQVFLDQNANYQFSDIEIAKNPDANWSYPSWPSQIDHVLLKKPLFEDMNQTMTITLDDCSSSYYNVVSDHRPVLTILNF